MTVNDPNELNLFTLPLTGRTLIEASAGTGKTYSLAFIYLRLLLGIGENNYSRPLTVDEILVVTFTKAATDELRYRIKQNIHQLRVACISGHHSDKDYLQLIELIDDKTLAIQRLISAEQSMDEATIFTIHGFCQRMLSSFAFEAGILFNQTLIKDESELYLQVVSDFWRDYFTPMPEDIARIIWHNWADPKALLADIFPYLSQSLPTNVKQTNQPLVTKINDYHHNNISIIQKIKDDWLESVNDIESVISQSGVSKRSYSKSNLPRWLDKISQWAKLPTHDYSLPDELVKFSCSALHSKTDEGKLIPSHLIFTKIEQFLLNDFEFRNFILFDIVFIIAQTIAAEKNSLAQLGFNDLLTTFNHALQGDNRSLLVKQIIQRYPVAMIDEFQDTDPVQYQIFDTLYHNKQQTCLLLIGDPKQAIYSFRGADIFTYIKAKSSVDHQFTMQTNWRSSGQMVDAVNSLFQRRSDPFIFTEIPFITMNSASKNQHKCLYVNGNAINAMQSYLFPESVTSRADYLEYAAEYCAEKISQLLTADSYFYDGYSQKTKISSADIAILVRTGREADIIQQQLSKRNIKSIYVSNHKSVFATLQAREVLRILQAVLSPTNEAYIRSALATQLIGASMSDIDALTYNSHLIESVVDEFREYQTVWQRYGVLVMLRRLMLHRKLAENILSRFDGERIITNFLHLGEILQTTAQDLDTPHALVRWLTNQIVEPDPNIENHEQRLDSDENLINIVTIHKSKGLEYPIVFLPFIGLHRDSDSFIYHDRETYQSCYAYRLSTEIKQLIEQERLAEDLRLLYVALTRSIYHCSFAIAGLKKGRMNDLAIKQSALGYLLLNNDQNDYATLATSLSQLAHTSVITVDLPIAVSILPVVDPTTEHQLATKIFKRKLDSSWRVTSYSGLLQSSYYDNNNTAALLGDILPAFDNEALSDIVNHDDDIPTSVNKINEQEQFDIHHFPKGAIVGTLLHECFENCDFEQPNAAAMINHLLVKLNLPDTWQQPLSDWLLGVLQTPLSSGLSLAHLSTKQRLNELQFYLPIRQEITAIDLDQLCKHYDPLTRQCESVHFLTVQGMLKGFIDMVFEWQGEYYIVDYKSNYLGPTISDYNQTALASAMCEHRYDLQYQLYSLALHRYLKSRITNYDYQSHFGGIYYLFVRGMVPNDSQHGIFYTKPQVEFINALDQLFA